MVVEERGVKGREIRLAEGLKEIRRVGRHRQAVAKGGKEGVGDGEGECDGGRGGGSEESRSLLG